MTDADHEREWKAALAALRAQVAELEAELKARDESDRLVKTHVDDLEREFNAVIADVERLREMVRVRDSEVEILTEQQNVLQKMLDEQEADVERLTRERDELRRANEGLRADATRLDWIEANAAIDQWNHSVGAVTTVFSRRISPRPLRVTIDAAMGGTSDG